MFQRKFTVKGLKMKNFIYASPVVLTKLCFVSSAKAETRITIRTNSPAYHGRHYVRPTYRATPYIGYAVTPRYAPVYRVVQPQPTYVPVDYYGVPYGQYRRVRPFFRF